VLVSSDGQVGEMLGEGMKVVVTRGAYEALLVRLETEGFFSRMRRALQWGDLTDRERV
jgi:NAD kinase